MAAHFIDVGLELGGKDVAYVAEDADLVFTVPNVVDGACYNAGQSCCAVERVYVHRSCHDAFIECAEAVMSEYRLGDLLDENTTMGPLASRAALGLLGRQPREGGMVCPAIEGRHRLPEPLRLSRSSPALDRGRRQRQGVESRDARLLSLDAPQEFSLPDRNLNGRGQPIPPLGFGTALLLFSQQMRCKPFYSMFRDARETMSLKGKEADNEP